MVTAVLQFLALAHIYHGPFTDLAIRGDPTEFKKFDGISEDLRPDLQHIELNYVEFIPDELVASLQNCDSLETLNLKRVKWTGEFSTRVDLPRLREFKLQIKNMTFRSLNKDQFKALLFFDKAPIGGTWKIEELSTLGMDISVNYGIQSVTIDRDERKVELMHVPFANDVLKAIKPAEFPVESLDLLHVSVNTGAIPRGLTHLSMASVNLRGGDLGSLFKKLRKLEEVDLDEVSGERFVASTLDIASLPSASLKKLFLSGITVTQLNPIEFQQLDHFRLMSCDVIPHLLRNFGQTFRNVREVEILAKDLVENHSLLKTVVDQTLAKKVHFSNFLRSEAGGTTGDIAEVEALLRNAGVPDDQQYFSMELVKGRWKWIDPAKSSSSSWRFWERWS